MRWISRWRKVPIPVPTGERHLSGASSHWNRWHGMTLSLPVHWVCYVSALHGLWFPSPSTIPKWSLLDPRGQWSVCLPSRGWRRLMSHCPSSAALWFSSCPSEKTSMPGRQQRAPDSWYETVALQQSRLPLWSSLGKRHPTSWPMHLFLLWRPTV